jgi:hypothetical protein
MDEARNGNSRVVAFYKPIKKALTISPPACIICIGSSFSV